MPRKSSPKSPTPVLANRHKDKRANIPTEELRDFVADDEKAPKNILYPRAPSLDSQLVWQGKQDRQPLEVPADRLNDDVLNHTGLSRRDVLSSLALAA